VCYVVAVVFSSWYCFVVVLTHSLLSWLVVWLIGIPLLCRPLSSLTTTPYTRAV
jgi:hypothetical protein